MVNPPAPTPTRPSPPRLVDQTRILLWFQFHLTLVSLLVTMFLAVLVEKHTHGYDADPVLEQRLTRLELLLLLLAATALVLAVAAATVRRGWWIGWPLAVLAEVAVLVDAALSWRAGVIVGLILALLLLLAVWTSVNLCRPELLRQLLRPRRS